MSKTTPAPEIEKIKLSTLKVDNKYSGRSEKEITENAKEKAKELEAFGGWNPAMPGQYFERDGEKHLLAGFSRVKASLVNGYEHGYFVKVDGDEVDYLLACETTNSTRQLSTLSRGARYSELLEGAIADDFSGQFADPKIDEHWKRKPMTLKEIAFRVGRTDAWVGRCIAIFQSPPDIRELIESDKIAAVVADEARKFCEKHELGEAKQIAMCKKAFNAARAEEKDTATKKHFEAIKGEFLPIKKLVADGKDDDKETKTTGKKASTSPATGSEIAGKGDTAELPSGDSESETDLEEPQNELFEHAADVTTEGTDKNTKLRAAWKTILMEPDNLEETTLDEETVDALVEKLHAAMIAARDVF